MLEFHEKVLCFSAKCAKNLWKMCQNFLSKTSLNALKICIFLFSQEICPKSQILGWLIESGSIRITMT